MSPLPHPRPSLARNLLRAATVAFALGFLLFYVLYASGFIQLHAAEGGYSPPPSNEPPKPPPVAPLATDLTIADLSPPNGIALPPGSLVDIGPPRDPVVIYSSKSIVMSFPTKRAAFPVGQFVVAANRQLVPLAIPVAPDASATTHTFYYLTTEAKVVIPITVTVPKPPTPAASSPPAAPANPPAKPATPSTAR